MFAGFGPLIVALICLTEGMQVSATSVFTAIVSSWALAFIVAGCSTFYQVESWGIGKATFLHMLALYAVYLGCYLLNGWIAAQWKFVGIFTAIFAGGYLVIWTVVMLCVKHTAKKLNTKLNQQA